MSRNHAPAFERNGDPIRVALRDLLPPAGLVLEVASGSGQHALDLARAYPALAWQPSDVDPRALASIEAWRDPALGNLRSPVALDVTAPTWPIAAADAVLCINMLHISPWEAALGLFRGSASILSSGAPLITYGPYRVHGVHTAPSNERFDASLRDQDPSWGVRDVDDLAAAAAAAGLHHERSVAMPANNQILVFRRR